MNAPSTAPWMSVVAAQRQSRIADLFYFRSIFQLHQVAPGVPVPVRITTDSRYRLTVNSVLVAAGPAKPSGGLWFIDTVDIAPHLRSGGNVLGIELLSYNPQRTGNASVLRTGASGLSVGGVVPGGFDLSSAASWRCTLVSGRTFLQGDNTLFLGIQECVDGNRVPQNWLSEGFDDSGWSVPSADSDIFLEQIERPRSRDRVTPAMALDPVPFAGMSACSDAGVGWDPLIGGTGPVEIGPNRVVQVDLDMGVLTTAYLDLGMIGGAGATVTLTAAECYEDVPVEIPWLRVKGDRTDAVNGDLYGDPDIYLVAGCGTPESIEHFAPFWFRTLRYLRVRVETADSSLILTGLRATRTRYPLAISGSFSSSRASDTALWTPASGPCSTACMRPSRTARSTSNSSTPWTRDLRHCSRCTCRRTTGWFAGL